MVGPGELSRCGVDASPRLGPTGRQHTWDFWPSGTAQRLPSDMVPPLGGMGPLEGPAALKSMVGSGGGQGHPQRVKLNRTGTSSSCWEGWVGQSPCPRDGLASQSAPSAGGSPRSGLHHLSHEEDGTWGAENRGVSEWGSRDGHSWPPPNLARPTAPPPHTTLSFPHRRPEGAGSHQAVRC